MTRRTPTPSSRPTPPMAAQRFRRRRAFHRAALRSRIRPLAIRRSTISEDTLRRRLFSAGRPAPVRPIRRRHRPRLERPREHRPERRLGHLRERLPEHLRERRRVPPIRRRPSPAWMNSPRMASSTRSLAQSCFSSWLSGFVANAQGSAPDSNRIQPGVVSVQRPARLTPRRSTHRCNRGDAPGAIARRFRRCLQARRAAAPSPARGRFFPNSPRARADRPDGALPLPPESHGQ